MLLAWALPPLLFGRLPAIREWLSQTDPYDPSPTPDETLEKELQRLAQTSPHLLADIGFVEMKQREDGKRVFCRGSLRVAV